MNTTKMTRFVRGVRKQASKHSPEILMGVGIAGMITSTVLAVKATPKAMRLLEEAETEGVNLTPINAVKVAWRPYIPAATTMVLSTACLIGSSSVSSRRTAAIATAYKISETALAEYKEKVIETIGENKEKGIRDKVAKKKVEDNPIVQKEIIITDKGNTLCYDAASGRYFRSDLEKIKRVVNELNRRMLSEMYISLNEMYSDLGLTGTTMGDELGWNIDQGLIELDFSSQIAEDGTPCIVIDYLVAPRYDYAKLM